MSKSHFTDRDDPLYIRAIVTFVFLIASIWLVVLIAWFVVLITM